MTLLSPIAALAQGTSLKKYFLGQFGAVEMQIPNAWNDAPPHPSSSGKIVWLRSKTDDNFLALLVPNTGAEIGIPFPTGESLRQRLRESIEKMMKESMAGQSSGILEFEAPQGRGYYVVAKKSPGLPSPRNFASGFLHLGNFLFTLTAVADDEQAIPDVVAAFKSARFFPSAQPPGEKVEPAAALQSAECPTHVQFQYVFSALEFNAACESVAPETKAGRDRILKAVKNDFPACFQYVTGEQWKPAVQASGSALEWLIRNAKGPPYATTCTEFEARLARIRDALKP